MKSHEDKDNIRRAANDILTALGAPLLTEAERVARLSRMQAAITTLNRSYTAYCLHSLDEGIDEIKALKPSREVLVEHFVFVGTKFFNLHNGVFAELYAVLRGARAQDPALTSVLSKEIETLAKFANGEQLSVISAGITLLSKEGEFFTEYRHMVLHLDPVARVELLAELKRAATPAPEDGR